MEKREKLKTGRVKIVSVVMGLATLLFGSGISMAATNVVIVAPGEEFVNGTGKTGTPQGQVHGIPFEVMVMSTTENHQPKETFALAQLKTPVNAAFDNNPHRLDQPSSGPTLHYQYTPFGITLRPGANTVAVITAQNIDATVTGISPGQVSIPVHYFNTIRFELPANWVAGQTHTITVHATDGVQDVPYTGTANVVALGGGTNGSNTGILNRVTFVNGIGTVPITLTYASNTIALRAQDLNPNPGTVTHVTSPSITVLAGAATNLLVLEAGQTVLEGSLPSGSGRTGTIGVKTVNQPFQVKVVATDEYWNIVSSNAAVSLALEEDMAWGGSVIPATQPLGNGVNFTVTLHRVINNQQQLLARAGGLKESFLAIPLQHAPLSRFSFAPLPLAVTAGQGITVSLMAYDAWGNTVISATGVTADVSLSIRTSEIIFDPSSLSHTRIARTEFTGDGQWAQTGFQVYRAGGGLRLRAQVGTVVQDSTEFEVRPNADSQTRCVAVLPGQSFTPGEYHDTWGRTNETPDPFIAGAGKNVSIFLCDFWGNRLTQASDTITLEYKITDVAATPRQVTAKNGLAVFNLTLTRAAESTQQITARSGTVSLSGVSSLFSVRHTTLDQFTLTLDGSGTRIAGKEYSLVLQARDVYQNPVLDFNGTVYLTCPILDYQFPTQSVIQVGGGTSDYTENARTARWKIAQGFSQGRRTVTIRIYRATRAGETAQLFLSENPDDRPDHPLGHHGLSNPLTVSPDTYRRVFCYLPGQTYRPGADYGTANFSGVGYVGSPLSQQAEANVTVTVLATDNYWNRIDTANDTFTLNSNYTPSNLQADGHACPWTTSFQDGRRELTLRFHNDASYTVTIDSAQPNTSVSDYTSPTVIIFTVHHFSFEAAAGGGWPATWTAGEAQRIRIRAYRDAENHVATSFAGTASLGYSREYAAGALKTLNPLDPIVFTDGVWEGEITVYRADSYTGEAGNYLRLRYGAQDWDSDPVHVFPGPVAKQMVMVESNGMKFFQGLHPSLATQAIQGNPSLQTAGVPVARIDIYLCDEYGNTIRDAAQGANGMITLASSDGAPYAAELMGVGALPRSVALSAGRYTATGSQALVFYTVNGTQGQSLRVTHAQSTVTPFEFGIQTLRVPVKHAEKLDRFLFALDPSIISHGAQAGSPFAVTITAVDAYGNTLNSVLGAKSFLSISPVNLSVDTDLEGFRSIWPYQTGGQGQKWIEGVCAVWLYAYKQVGGAGQRLKANYNQYQGTSAAFQVTPGEFARTIPIVYDGMKIPDAQGAGGTYMGDYALTPPPAQAEVFNNFGVPNPQRAGTPTTVYVYSTDIYGNMVKHQDVWVYLHSTDRFAPRCEPQRLEPTEGFTVFTQVVFHTQGEAELMAGTVEPGFIAPHATPLITVIHGDYYGVQVLIPGLLARPGSGVPNLVQGTYPLQSGGWYSGVTPTEPELAYGNCYYGRAEYAGVTFTATVIATDAYGNPLNDDAPSHRIELWSDDEKNYSQPTESNRLTSRLVKGRADFDCCLYSTRQIELGARDLDSSGIKGSPDSRAFLKVAEGSDTLYRVIVNGVHATDNHPVYVKAWPETFTIQAELRFNQTNEIVASHETIVVTPMTWEQGRLVPATGELGRVYGQLESGVCRIIQQTYTRAESIMLRVQGVSSETQPVPGLSAEIRVQASAPALIEMAANESPLAGAVYTMVANDTVPITAWVYDANRNPVPEQAVEFEIVNQAETSSYLGTPKEKTTNSQGQATCQFYAGANNRLHYLRSHAGEIFGEMRIQVSVTPVGGVYPNPFNPLQGQVAHIDYRLEQEQPVRLAIYTLWGDLVWHQDLAAGSEGARSGINSVAWTGQNDRGQPVTSGGYICAIRAAGREIQRFKLGVLKAE